MMVTVLFFAQARDRAGRDRLALELPEGSRVSDALDAIRRDHPALAELEAHLAVAVDGRLAKSGATLTHGAELALLPPVSGG
jgi:molybdopterin synthase catalytic subunit